MRSLRCVSATPAGFGDCDACPPGLRSVTRRRSFALGYTPPPACGAIPRDDRSGDQRPILRQMYWNDRLDVQIGIRLITQAVAIVEIELNGTLTRSPTGFSVGSSAKPTSCCNSPNTTLRRLGCRSRPARVTLEALSSGSVWLALGATGGFWRDSQTTVSTGR
jgi:hypothetical protein